MHRFFCPQAKFDSGVAEITDKKEIHHLRDVLRLKVGDAVVIFDGKGGEADAEILSNREDLVALKINHIRGETPKALSILLACAIPKKSKFETIIEKCTELGVDEIIPLITQRTEVRLTPERALSKISRFQSIAVNAAKQSCRKTVPIIHPAMSIKEVTEKFSSEDTILFIPCLTGTRTDLKSAMQKVSKRHKQILFLIGPEGDFTPEEVSLAVKQDCLPVSLGKTVLKVDTAAITVVATAKIFCVHE
ncbi:MAG TPA: RsmE family RNA methyltransferase [Candidatus Omnitrophota bacterium]|nr:RsmE family RNA methyltransferase [Candidatus Omnitrophota bacterium]HPD85306.1 RsmE family RNA methyltransferase [Candidatus Omnitrophota bacterium]HRZ04193.1 RsmE family RNA methyltransferase [Candidatus Omnitrophota bacterium]